jgi:hypothetical protein
MFEHPEEIATLTKKFNELNKQKKGHSSYCEIKGFQLFNKKPNGATCSIMFHEMFHGQEKDSQFEFVDENHLINYLKEHT